jgi:hypothetical protein
LKSGSAPRFGVAVHYLTHPIRGHPLASIKPTVFLSGPSLMFAPLLEVGLDAVCKESAPGGLESLASGRCAGTQFT